MKLLYRGISYEAPIQPAPSDSSQPKVRLIYRGNTYDYKPLPSVSPEPIPADTPMVNLMYRGNTYQRRSLTPQLYQQPRALNWRWMFS
jgi:hypothetical protein